MHTKRIPLVAQSVCELPGTSTRQEVQQLNISRTSGENIALRPRIINFRVEAKCYLSASLLLFCVDF